MGIPMITIDNEEGTGIYKLPLYLYDIVGPIFPFSEKLEVIFPIPTE